VLFALKALSVGVVFVKAAALTADFKRKGIIYGRNY